MSKPKKVLFHCEQLNYRGTTNSVVDYAHFNQHFLGHESVIMYSTENPEGADVGTVQQVVNELSNKFKVIPYSSHEEANEIAAAYDLCYSQRAGWLTEFNSGKKTLLINSTKFAVHCVFQWYEPHGDKYAYISEWLAKKVQRDYQAPEQLYVPYIVDLPKPNYDTKAHLGIPKDKFVIGRHGGFNTFDIPFVKNVVTKIANERNDIVFLFANTDKFVDHPNVIFMPPFFGQQQKSNFINACDAMLHARNLGESFGLSIAEFLFFNKPVLSWEGGFDRNHIELLSGHDLIYSNEEDLYKRILSLRDHVGKDYKSIVKPYSPQNVMRQFKANFIR